MNSIIRAGIVAGAVISLAAGGVGIAAQAATHTSGFRACSTSSGTLGLLKSGGCAKGSHKVSIAAQGSVITLPKTLPSRQAETGTFALSGEGGGDLPALDSVGFTVALKTALNGAHAPSTGPKANSDTKHCRGSAAHPTAAPGYFCLYPGVAENVDVVIAIRMTAYQPGTSTAGATILVDPKDNTMSYAATGTWAVTAP